MVKDQNGGAARGSRRRPGKAAPSRPSEPYPAMPFSVLDLVVLGIVLVSALLAAVRGVTREVLAIIAAGSSAAATRWCSPMTARPAYSRPARPSPT